MSFAIQHSYGQSVKCKKKTFARSKFCSRGASARPHFCTPGLAIITRNYYT